MRLKQTPRLTFAFALKSEPDTAQKITSDRFPSTPSISYITDFLCPRRGNNLRENMNFGGRACRRADAAESALKISWLTPIPVHGSIRPCCCQPVGWNTLLLPG
ncbi:hypothetical protein EVAR_92202_1 [Eumeta japonica]|uniref:Uncharacterized protein n=1 Tax=Eumeta variegata TaxID=151549 RepID=A0A4C1TM93_EUMVA|nr:hypothetical protein EVAR_92202_1 [Eumeta japonica]